MVKSVFIALISYTNIILFPINEGMTVSIINH